MRLDFEESRPIAADTEARVLLTLRERLCTCDIVVISDYAKALITRRVCESVIAEAHTLGKQVIVDPRPQHRAYYAHCDYLTPNWKESQGLLGRPEEPPTEQHIEESARALVRLIDN